MTQRVNDGSYYFLNRNNTDYNVEPFSTTDQLYLDAGTTACTGVNPDNYCKQATQYKNHVDEYNALVNTGKTMSGAYQDELVFYNRDVMHNYHLVFGIALMLGTIHYLSK